MRWYLTKPVANAELVRSIEARLRRSEQQVKREFKPDFSSSNHCARCQAERAQWFEEEKSGLNSRFTCCSDRRTRASIDRTSWALATGVVGYQRIDFDAFGLG